MADRCTLHINKLDEFKEWLIQDGWEILPISRNPYEVLRAKKKGKQYPLVVYKKAEAKEHLSIADMNMPIVEAFLRDSKKKRTNADRIRAMSDEELAEFLINYHACDNCEHDNGLNCEFNNVCKKEYATAMSFKWLQSEAEE